MKSDRPGNPRDGDATREAVIAALLEMIAERGVTGVSTRDLAKQVGVSEALIFHHFKNKAGLLAAAALNQETMLAAMSALFETDAPKDVATVINGLSADAAQRMRPGSPGAAYAAMLLSHDHRMADVREQGLEVLRETEARFGDWLDRGGEISNSGLAAARSFFEGVIFLVATLPSDKAGWDAEAPKAFADLAARWRANHLKESLQEKSL